MERPNRPTGRCREQCRGHRAGSSVAKSPCRRNPLFASKNIGFLADQRRSCFNQIEKGAKSDRGCFRRPRLAVLTLRTSTSGRGDQERNIEEDRE
jgi:hypothetical protein